MKVKIAILSVIFAIVSFAVASKTTAERPKVKGKEISSAETKVGRGLPMEDKDQLK